MASLRIPAWRLRQFQLPEDLNQMAWIDCITERNPTSTLAVKSGTLNTHPKGEVRLGTQDFIQIRRL